MLLMNLDGTELKVDPGVYSLVRVDNGQRILPSKGR